MIKLSYKQKRTLMEKTTIKISKVFKGASYTLKKLKLLQLHP